MWVDPVTWDPIFSFIRIAGSDGGNADGLFVPFYSYFDVYFQLDGVIAVFPIAYYCIPGFSCSLNEGTVVINPAVDLYEDTFEPGEDPAFLPWDVETFHTTCEGTSGTCITTNDGIAACYRVSSPQENTWDSDPLSVMDLFEIVLNILAVAYGHMSPPIMINPEALFGSPFAVGGSLYYESAIVDSSTTRADPPYELAVTDPLDREISRQGTIVDGATFIESDFAFFESPVQLVLVQETLFDQGVYEIEIEAGASADGSHFDVHQWQSVSSYPTIEVLADDEILQPGETASWQFLPENPVFADGFETGDTDAWGQP
jgi:hypothetical protein